METIHSHNNFFYFTASLIFLLLASAFVSTSPKGEDHLIIQAVIFATELVAYFSLNLSRKWRRFVGLMLILMFAGSVAREFTDWAFVHKTGLGVGLVFYCGMAYAAARQVLLTGDVDLNNIVGALAIFLLLGLIWTILYLITMEIWPAGFNGIEYKNWHDNFGNVTYFSFVTITTLGYGEITPAIPITRTLAFLQAVTGTFYMAVVVATMVGRVSRTSK